METTLKQLIFKFLKLTSAPEASFGTLAFDENRYLAAYPDVARAVASGEIASGKVHYKLHGRKEGRNATGPSQEPSNFNILDAYVKIAPSDQNVIDLFQGEWSSTMPSNCNLISSPGPSALFEDDRMTWANEVLGGFRGKEILELGPLEGGHSYMLQNAGAKSVVSIESNQRAFMKCLCIKEIFNLDRVHFKLGDFVSFLETTDVKFDALIASGVLYHMTDPISVLTKMARVSDKLFFWTHYYDEEFGMNHGQTFAPPHVVSLSNSAGKGAKRYYREALKWRGFCGGSEAHAVWLSKDTILTHLDNLGFKTITIKDDQFNHPNGPAFSFCAQRKRTSPRIPVFPKV